MSKKVTPLKWTKTIEQERPMLTVQVGRVCFHYSINGNNLFFSIGGKGNLVTLSLAQAKRLVSKNRKAFEAAKTATAAAAIVFGEPSEDQHET